MKIKLFFIIILFFNLKILFSQNPYIKLSKKYGLEHSFGTSKFYEGELYTTQFYNSNQQLFLKLTIRNQIGNIRYDHDFYLGTQTNSNELSINNESTSLQIENGNIYIVGAKSNNASLNVLLNQNLQNYYNSFLIFISEQSILSNSGSIDYFSYITGNQNTLVDSHYCAGLEVENGNVYLLFSTNIANLYTSNFSSYFGYKDAYLIKISAFSIVNNLNFQNDSNSFASYFGTTNDEYVDKLKVIDGDVYFINREFAGTNDFYSLHKIKKSSIDNQLSLTQSGAVSTYVSDEFHRIDSYFINNNEIYIAGQKEIINPNFQDVYLLKLSQAEFDLNSNIISYYSIAYSEIGYWIYEIQQILIYEDMLYIIGYISDSAESTRSFVKQIPISVIESNQSILQSNLPKTIMIGLVNYTTSNIYSFDVNELGIHIFGTSYSCCEPGSIFNYIPTNSTTISSSNFYLNFCLNTDYNYGTSIGYGKLISEYYNNKLYSCVEQSVYNFDHTVFTLPDQSSNLNANNHLYAIIDFDTLQVANTHDTLTPSSQTVCAFATCDPIIGSETIFETSTIPNILEVGVGEKNQNIPTFYCWEKANAVIGPWSSIPNASLKDYLPIVTNQDTYYRRKTFQIDCGDTLFLDTSNVSAVLINQHTAPIVDAGGVFHTCPLDDVIIGGNPTASGGLAPYQYFWDNNLGASSNPNCSVGENSIVTLKVIDSNGCKKVDQAIIYMHKADAGIDKSVCGGDSVIIGSNPIQGIPNISYLWSPEVANSCTNCLFSTVAPNVQTTYTLNMTLMNSDGDYCTTSDEVLIRVQNAPNLNFAGNDTTICIRDNLTIGTLPEMGFDYQWYSYLYLSNYQNLQTNFNYYSQHLNTYFQNPHYKFVQASQNGCDFIDEVAISVIEANAGSDVCGPSVIGSLDQTPNLSETYNWVKISGPAYFTGPTNQPWTTVSASVGDSSVFELTVSLNGVSCTDQVVINNCDSIGSRCMIYTNDPVGCPSNLLSDDPIYLEAGFTSSTSVLQYSWTPEYGLSNYDSSSVQLLTDDHITYTVIVTDPNDPTFLCTNFIEVNNPDWILPIVDIIDSTVCLNDLVQLTTSNNPNYMYQWTQNGNLISGDGNAFFSLEESGMNEFNLRVTDNVTKCRYYDTAHIYVRQNYFVPSEDWSACSNVLVELGNPSNVNLNHYWEPSNAPWQNGTSNLDAQPQVILNISTTFVNTMIDTFGCVAKDTVQVYIDQLPPLLPLQDVYFCLGQDSMQIGNPAQNGLTYSWFPSTGLSCLDCAQPKLAYQSSPTSYFLTVGISGNCASSIQQSVLVSPSNQAISIPDITYCPSDGPVNLANNVQISGYSQFYWFPSNLVSNNSILNPTTNVSDTTTFYLRLTNNIGCNYTDTIQVIPTVIAPKAGYDQSICLGEGSVILGDISNSGNLSWSSAANLSNSTSPTVIFTPDSAGIFNFDLTLTAGNCSAIDQVKVIVNEINTPDLSSKFICSNSCTEIGVPNNPEYSYSWSPAGNLSDPTISNPIACISQATSFSVLITSVEGCMKTDQMILSLSDSIAPSISLPPIIVCNDSLNFSVNPAITPQNGNYIYSWYPTIGIDDPYSLQAEFLTVLAQQNSYTLMVTNISNGCSTYKNLDLSIVNCPDSIYCDIPFTIVATSDSICSGENFALAFNSDTSNVSYHWNASGNQVYGYSSGSAYNLEQTLSTMGGGIGQVTYQITPHIGNCYGQAQSVTVIVLPVPKVSVNGNLIYCQNDSIYLSTNSLFESYLWSNGSTSSASYFTSSDNPISLSVINSYGCQSNTNQVTVIEFPAPISSFEFHANTEFYPNAIINFENHSTNSDNFIWMLDNGQDNLYTEYLNTQSAQYITAGNYNVALVAIDNQTGCADTSYLSFTIPSDNEIKNCNPNYFSPNGDGINDHFYFDFCEIAISSLKVEIFNRWGNEIKKVEIPYNSADPESYWDGTSNGKDCTEGTYFYIYEVTTKSGTIITDHGYLTLIRNN